MELLHTLLNVMLEHYKVLVTVLAVLSYPFIAKLQQALLVRSIVGRIDPHRKHRAELLMRILLAMVMFCLLLVFWGIELKGLLVVGSSLFAMLGVGLFAGWSLLSNLTSFLLMFVQNNCRVGDWIRVIDGANHVEGKVVEMGLMHMVLEHIDGHRVLYPNNLFIVRPVMVLNKPPKKAASPSNAKRIVTNKQGAKK